MVLFNPAAAYSTLARAQKLIRARVEALGYYSFLSTPPSTLVHSDPEGDAPRSGPNRAREARRKG